MKRDNSIDNAKGILILLVLFGHLISSSPIPPKSLQTTYLFIYLFHIPMFAFISGKLANLIIDKKRLHNSINGLLIPFLIFATINWVISITLSEKEYFPLTNPGPLWYLFSLFCWRLLLPILLRTPSPLIISVTLTLTCGFFPLKGLEKTVAKTLYFLPFFLMGHFAVHGNHKKLFIINKKLSIAIISCAVALAYLLPWYSRDFLLATKAYYYFLLEPFTGVTLRLLLLVFSFYLILSFNNFIPKKEGMITNFGKKSLYIYILHTPLLLIYRLNPDYCIFFNHYSFFLPLITISSAWILSSSPVISAYQRIVSLFSLPIHAQSTDD